MKYKPVDVADHWGDKWMSCGRCGEPLVFPFPPNGKRPTRCYCCKAEIDWEEGVDSSHE